MSKKNLPAIVNKKPSFWQIMKTAISDAKKAYKARVNEYVEKQKLINSKSNWYLLETFVQQCNKDPNLRVHIRTADGTEIDFRTWKPETRSVNERLDQINIEA